MRNHTAILVSIALSLAGTNRATDFAAPDGYGNEGPAAFRATFDTDSGRIASVSDGGCVVFAADPEEAKAVEFAFEGGPGSGSGRQDVESFWRWRLDWRTHPLDRMLQGTLSFEWRGEAPVRLKSITIHHGKLAGGACGAARRESLSDLGRNVGANTLCDPSYILSGLFPPLSRTFADFRPGRVEEGSEYTPFAFGANGAGSSVMLAHDELRPYSDYAKPLVTERADGICLSTRYESAGWIRPNEPQTVGDFWLVFRDGSTEDHLRHTGNWFRKIGMAPPADRPEWVRDIVSCYSMHPCGRNDDMRCDPDGLALSRSYLPFLQALGVNCVWMRPIEDKSPYMPRDYYRLQPGVGSAEDLAEYVADAHSRGMRVWRDAVPHGGHVDFPRAKEHPEFLAWKEDGRPDTWWTYDYFNPGWLSTFSGIVRDLTAEAALDGWRIDVATGSRFPNWNPDVPYARGSFARCQGALAMNRAIRAAARAVTPDAATLGETTRFSGAAVCDSTYDFRPNLMWFWRFTDTPVADCVRNIRRHLHECQAALPPGAIQVRYMENHDSHPALPLFGRAGATALFAMTAFCDGYPLIYQEAEDGCFEAMREILRVRRETPELLHGDADYDCVSAPEGVFAVLRTLGDGAVMALVNFNGKSARGEVSWPGGAFDCDLPPFGWEVRRVAGEGAGTSRVPQSSRRSPAVPAQAPDATASGQGPEVFAALLDGTSASCRIATEPLPSGAVRYRVADLAGMDATNVQIVVRLPNASRWFAQTAEGDFDGTSFVRHPRLGWVGSTVKHGRHDTSVRWTSLLHPFGFTSGRACVGLESEDGAAIVLSGFNARFAEVCILDRVHGDPGLAIAIRAGDPAGLVCEVDNCDLRFVNNGDLAFVNNSAPSLTGLPELTAVMAGWEWESGGLRLAIRRNGTLRGAWRRDPASGGWRQVAGTVDIRTDTGVGRKDPFGNPDNQICSQNDAFGDPIRFWKSDDGAVHLDFGPGDLRTFDAKMAVPIWYRTRYTLRPGADDFELEAAISIERDYAKGEGEIVLRVAGDDGSSYRWLTPETSLSMPKGAWRGVRLHFGKGKTTQTTKETTHE